MTDTPPQSPKPKLNVLLIGGGGREHALALAIKRSPRLATLYATHTTNPGIAKLAQPVDVPATTKEIYRLAQFCDAKDIGLVVIGPEDPLADGWADALGKRADGSVRPVFGPSKAAARLESDKAFAKHIMRAASVPTGDARIFTDAGAAEEYLKTRDELQVIKAAGLAKGKGVIVPYTNEEGLPWIDKIMRQRCFGDAGKSLLIEERLEGPEVSVLALCDGHHILVLPPCQDHKRLGDDDSGPNTGGMGAFCPAATLDDETMAEVERDIFVPTIDAMRREDIEFRGVLYAGIMLTPAGPKVLEFNVRFGDPECQALLSLLETDCLEMLLATATGTLDEAEVRFSTDSAVCVVMASEGYPANPQTGRIITGLDEADAVPGVNVIHAGTARQGENFITSGGRVLGITARGTDLTAARAAAYEACKKTRFDGVQFRKDIATHAAAQAQ
ncbi:MAG: phosphoribosylamine--glycine ligase [Phycisphaerales bacterium]|jgi:phosphoribosylamine--glycine ligase